MSVDLRRRVPRRLPGSRWRRVAAPPPVPSIVTPCRDLARVDGGQAR